MRLVALLAFILILSGCSAQTRQAEGFEGRGDGGEEISSVGWTAPTPDYSKPATFVHEWNRILIEIIKVDGFTPGSAARNYAYANVAAYQAALPSFPECRTMAGQLLGLSETPMPADGLEYDYRVAVVSAFENVTPMLIYRRTMSDSAAAEHYAILTSMGVSDEVMERSKAYGKKVAESIITWMKGDNFVKIGAKTRYEVPKFDGAWERTPPSYFDPVDAYWGMHRTFALDSARQFLPPPPPPFSTDPDSEFYKMAKEVYDYKKDLEPQQAAVALYWDCNPIHSYFDGHFMYNTRQVSPGGHWISIAGIAMEKAETEFMESLENYILVSMAITDGFISSFDAKYHYNLIRPVTYINKYIDPAWEPLIETPPFPEWTSAHSTISAAAAAVLTERLGDDFEFVDYTEAFLGMPLRQFDSFREAAMEVTMSRVYGGIHYTPACINGTELGWQIGEYVVEKVKTRK